MTKNNDIMTKPRYRKIVNNEDRIPTKDEESLVLSDKKNSIEVTELSETDIERKEQIIRDWINKRFKKAWDALAEL